MESWTNPEILIAISNLLVAIGTAIIATIIKSKMGSKEYQIYEDLKFQIMKIIATMRSIDAKAAIALDKIKEHNQKQFVKDMLLRSSEENNSTLDYSPDYSSEKQFLLTFHSDPGFLIFLGSIRNSEIRCVIENIIRNIIERIDSFDDTYTRGASHLLIKRIKYSLNRELIKNKDTFNQLINMCEMEGVFTNFDYEKIDFHIVYLKEKGCSISDTYYNKSWEELACLYPNEFESFLKKDFVLYLQAQNIIINSEDCNIKNKSLKDLKKKYSRQYKHYHAFNYTSEKVLPNCNLIQ